jgi:hypothetical protein
MGLTAAEVRTLQEKCRTDLRFLCRDILGMDAWEDSLHNDLALFLASPDDKKLILVPRGHLKSSIVTVGWIIQQILKDFNVRILITNAVWDRARDFLYQINGFLTDKSLLSEIFGRFDGPGSKFTIDAITVGQRTKGTIKEATITTAGVEKALTGGHYDIIVHDDLVEENNINTKEQIQKIIRFYENSLDLLDPGGKLLVVGTRWAMGDLYGHLIETQMDSLNHKPVMPEQRVLWRELLKK